MREKAVLLGPTRELVGIMTEPRGEEAKEGPAVILLNAGLVHRVGPNRLYVHLARELASAGFRSLRFDLSGIGDSRSRNEPFLQAAVADTRGAMDFVSSTRATQRFVLMGICSGADLALQVARDDPRVAGLVLIEGFGLLAQGSLRYLFDANRHRLLRPGSWLRFLAGRSELWTDLRAAATPREEAASDRPGSTFTSPAPVLADLRIVGERGVRFLFAYAGKGPAWFAHRTMLKKQIQPLELAGRARVQHFEHTDHVFTPLEAQDALIQGIRGFMSTLG
ncbi:MAG TPA: alpha/beta fold hydrolase [Vicinamibacteria bacterium]